MAVYRPNGPANPLFQVIERKPKPRRDGPEDDFEF